MGFAFNNEITYNVKKIGEQNGKRFNNKKCIKKYCIFFIAIFIVIFLTDIVRNGRFVLLATVKPIVGLTSTPEKAVSETVAYLTICFIGIPFITDYNIISSIFRGLGDSKSPMYFIAVACMANIVLDYIFIYPTKMGVAGAALATIIGQFVSLFVAMYFHYYKNKEINGNICYIKANAFLIKGIYMIGASAALMQCLLAVMMAGMNAILGLAQVDPAILIGSFGIYYKIQQIALFSAFGLSNTIISILSFNYGMKDRKRIDECIKFGIVDTIIVSLMITLLFELLAHPLSQLFGLSGSTQEMIDICSTALHIASLGFVFMGISVAIQGVLQSIGYAIRPLMIALLRLVIFVFPIAYFFTLTENVTTLVWWTFPISELLTVIVSFIILKKSYNERISPIKNESITNNLVIAISREHGTNGKEIARQVAKELNIEFYDKERIKEFALKHGFVSPRRLQ